MAARRTGQSYGTPYVAAGMQQMYQAVRSQGASNLVFVAGNNWASTPSTLQVSGTNIVKSVHAQGWGWIAFAWPPFDGVFNLNADAGPNFEPTPAGASILAGLAKN